MKVLNVGSTEGSCDQQALETDRIQLKDTITSLRIQLDGLKVENVSLKRRYDELSKANTHSQWWDLQQSEKTQVLASGSIPTVQSTFPSKKCHWLGGTTRKVAGSVMTQGNPTGAILLVKRSIVADSIAEKIDTDQTLTKFKIRLPFIPVWNLLFHVRESDLMGMMEGRDVVPTG
ncbi:hypothetical protein Tco_0184154 [Tanacetum coccineum]